MKNDNNRKTTGATSLLQEVLDRAAEVEAEVVELERAPDGLEFIYRRGNTGFGGLLEDRKMEGPLVRLFIDRAGLEDEIAGTFTWLVQGRSRDIHVEVYDSFGESCFRLKLGRLKRR